MGGPVQGLVPTTCLPFCVQLVVCDEEVCAWIGRIVMTVVKLACPMDLDVAPAAMGQPTFALVAV